MSLSPGCQQRAECSRVEKFKEVSEANAILSAVDTSLEGHNYFQTNKSVLADLFVLLHSAKRPEERKYLKEILFGPDRYWLFTLETPPDE